MKYIYFEKDQTKSIRSEKYNSDFDTVTGLFKRWGSTIEDDPAYSPFGPEILDIEISSGKCKGNCPWCYKGNTSNQSIKYMSLETFKSIFDKLDTNVCGQIAFGITDIDANPDFWDIMQYARSHNVVPNYTTNGIGVTDEVAQKTHDLCGACAVSIYSHTKEIAYDAIAKYTATGMTQVNIHFMLSQETLDFAYQVLQDLEEDSRLQKVNAIVFLQYKDKNPKATHHSPTFDQFKALVDFCLQENIRFGFDSCSGSMFMKSVVTRPNATELIQYVDNCESSLMSFYLNVDGVAYPCSFLEGIGVWEEGIDVTKVDNFFKEVWYNDKIVQYRDRLINSSKSCACSFSGQCRSCMEYDINKCKV